MEFIRKNDDLIAKSVAAQQEADKAMRIKGELKTITTEENEMQAKNLHLLETHAQIIHSWTRKLENSIQLLDEEILYQIGRKNCLKKAIATLRIAANVNAESQFCRSVKMDGDYNDDIGKEILKEKILIETVHSQLETGMVEVEEYIEKMKAAKVDLESLWSNKYENYNIECDNINLKQSSSNTILKYGSTHDSKKEITQSDWEKNIKIHLKLSEELLTESHNTHSKINEHILSMNQRKLREQAQLININLMKKKSHVDEYIHTVESQLRRIIQKYAEVEKTIQKTEDTIKYLNQSLKLSQTRLYNRLQKPIQERFFDEAQNGLLSEEEKIRKQILSLKKEICQLQDNLRQLLSERLKMESQIQLKLNNTWIDGNQCLKIRNLYPSVKDLSGY